MIETMGRIRARGSDEWGQCRRNRMEESHPREAKKVFGKMVSGLVCLALAFKELLCGF